MGALTATITAITITAGSIAGCQPPPSDQFQPGIPVVEQAPIPLYGGNGAVAVDPPVRTTCTVQVREAAGIPAVDEGCQLNVYMTLDTIDGVTPEQRCLNMGGQPRYLNPTINCIDVAV